MDLTKASKFLSLILRHNPSAADITIDPNGWAVVADLVDGISKKGFPEFTSDDLVSIVESDSKSRYAFNEDGTKIRANQGHSIQVDLCLQPIEPPSVLYHGTATRFVGSIRATGLHAASRQHVHLSASDDTAVKVGSRHGTHVVLTIDAAAMYNEGLKFFRSENGVWLTNTVPAKFIKE